MRRPHDGQHEQVGASAVALHPGDDRGVHGVLSEEVARGCARGEGGGSVRGSRREGGGEESGAGYGEVFG